MATSQITLPEGFVIDQPTGKQQVQGSQLPSGFVVDKPNNTPFPGTNMLSSDQGKPPEFWNKFMGHGGDVVEGFGDVLKAGWKGGEEAPKGVIRGNVKAVAGMGNMAKDVTGLIVGSIVGGLTPDAVKKKIAEVYPKALESPGIREVVGTLGELQSQWNEVKSKDPGTARFIEDSGSIYEFLAGFVPGEKIAKAGGKAVAKETGNIAHDVQSWSLRGGGEALKKGFDVQMDQAIDKGVRKTILTGGGKVNYPQVQKYMDNARTAIKYIAVNKESLKLADATGDIVQGGVPHTLDEFSQAVTQSKGALIKAELAAEKEAGRQGAKMSLEPLAVKLEQFGTDPTIGLTGEGRKAQKYSLKQAEIYRAKGMLNPEEAQKHLVELNKNFDSFLKSPSPQKAIDVIAGNNVREMLDTMMTQATGTAISPTRKAYGALSAIEKDVVKKALKDMTTVGGPGWIDIIAGEEFVTGLMTMNPVAITRGAALKGMSSWRKTWKDPNRMIENMFEDVGKLAEKQGKIGQEFDPKSKFGQFLRGMSAERRQGIPPRSLND